MKFEVYKDQSGYWRWRLRAGNNQILASGEGYYNKPDCLAAVKLVQSSGTAPIYEV